MSNKIKKIKYNIVLFIIIIFNTNLVSAQNNRITDLSADSIPALTIKLIKFINGLLIPFFVLVSLAYFLIGVVQYIGASEDTKKEDLKKKIFWGIVGLFIMLSIWSLVLVISNTFGINTGTNKSFMSLVK